MAEGRTVLNQHVVDIGYWPETEQAPPLDRVELARTCATAIGFRERTRRLEEIRHAVETEVLPRVALSHERNPDRPTGSVSAAQVGAFVDLLLAHDDAAIVAHVAAVQAEGVPVDDIYLHLFQPAARQIGDYWCDDLCTFMDVTLAVGVLQKLLRDLSPVFHINNRAADGSRQALIVPLPGEQHTFGLAMVSEFMRRAGWSVWSTPFASRESLSDTVGRLWFAVVGFTASTDDRLDELAAVIRQVRRDSCNTAVRVMVGGPLFLAHPDYVIRVGADGVGTDAIHALTLAESFVAAIA